MIPAVHKDRAHDRVALEGLDHEAFAFDLHTAVLIDRIDAVRLGVRRGKAVEHGVRRDIDEERVGAAAS